MKSPPFILMTEISSNMIELWLNFGNRDAIFFLAISEPARVWLQFWVPIFPSDHHCLAMPYLRPTFQLQFLHLRIYQYWKFDRNAAHYCCIQFLFGTLLCHPPKFWYMCHIYSCCHRTVHLYPCTREHLEIRFAIDLSPHILLNRNQIKTLQLNHI